MKNQKQQKDFMKRVKIYIKDSEKSLKRNELVMQAFVYFPKKEKSPLLSRIALRIVALQGGIMDNQLIDLKNRQNRL